VDIREWHMWGPSLQVTNCPRKESSNWTRKQRNTDTHQPQLMECRLWANHIPKVCQGNILPKAIPSNPCKECPLHKAILPKGIPHKAILLNRAILHKELLALSDAIPTRTPMSSALP